VGIVQSGLRQAVAFPLASFDTRDVPARDRIDYWEHRCTERIVGLRCTSMSENGLVARFEYNEFGTIKMIDITGNQHVIERSPSLLRRFEKDSVFVSFLRKGSAFVNRAQTCTVVGEGDVVIYDTNRPYMHGFPGEMHHVIYEIPGADFRARFPQWQLDEAVRFDARFNPTRLVSQALRKVVEADLTQLATRPQQLAHEDRLWKVLQTAHSLATGKVVSAYHTAVRDRMRQYIEAHLRDPDLSPAMIAGEMGMSVRQLNRLFEGGTQTVTSMIQTRRLQGCHADLTRPGRYNVNVSEIAYSWCFRNLSHFSRRFREEFGASPTEVAGKAKR